MIHSSSLTEPEWNSAPLIIQCWMVSLLCLALPNSVAFQVFFSSADSTSNDSACISTVPEPTVAPGQNHTLSHRPMRSIRPCVQTESDQKVSPWEMWPFTDKALEWWAFTDSQICMWNSPLPPSRLSYSKLADWNHSREPVLGNLTNK